MNEMTTTEPVEILLADDSDVGRYVIATTLRRAGFVVREVSNGTDAWHALTLRPPDLAVLDVKMPGLNGMELCRRIKSNADTSFVPVLLLSATFLDTADRVEGLDIGADGYLTQPVEAPVLIASIRSLLRVREAERAERRAASEWRVTFDAIGDAVALIDGEGVIRRCNRAFATLVGISSEETAGRLLAELLPDLEGVVRNAGDSDSAVEIGVREFRCRVDELPDPEAASHAVLTLRDVTAEQALGREREIVLRRERLISKTLQEALVPGRLPSIPGLALSAKYVLGEADVVVGGDWFDVIPIPGGVWLTIGDYAGHGVIATARAVQLRNNLRLLADEGYQPAEAMARLSELLESGGEVEIATATIVALSEGGDTGEFVSAGHPPALLVRSGGSPVLLEELGGPLLGYPRARYTATELAIADGDTFVLYTDGLVERRGETIDAGIARLVAAVGQVDIADLAEHAFSTLLPKEPFDDAAILVAQIVRDPGVADAA